MSFLAIAATGSEGLGGWDSDKVLCLSPHVMLWNKENGGKAFLLVDMEVTMDYWRAQLSRSKDPWSDLQKIFEQKNNCTCTLVVADHPWRSLLLLKSALRSEERFLHDHSPKAREAYAHIPWSLWFESFQEWLKISFANNSLTRQEVDFEKIKKFQRFTTDMGFSCLSDFAKAHPSDMERRFGTPLSLAWEWTRTPSLQPSLARKAQVPTWYIDSLCGFFWQAAFIPPKRSVARVLDFVFKDWEWIKTQLLDDFKRLAKTLLPSEGILKLCWHTRSVAKISTTIDIVFRYPYKPEDTEASWMIFTIQAEHAYNTWRKRVVVPDEGGYSWSPSSLGLVEWSLEIVDVFQMVSKEISLFAEGGWLLAKEDHTLRELEMKLTCRLEKYSLKANHIPEESFDLIGHAGEAKKDAASPITKTDDSLFFHGIKQGTSQRWPLFVWNNPQPTRLEPCEKILFAERVSQAWWIDIEPQPAQKDPLVFRDFYLAVNPLGRFRHIYKTPEGMWFEYGLFD